MGLKNNDPCLEKALDHERLFILMARDSNAPAAIMEWIKLSLGTQPEEKLREAFECAMEMIKTRDDINAVKISHNGKLKKMQVSIRDLSLSVRTFNCLNSAGIKTIGDLVNLNLAWLLGVRNIGKKGIKEVEDLMDNMGLKFKGVVK